MAPVPPIEWRLHLRLPPETVFDAWTTDAGRMLFWAERSLARTGGFDLDFIGGERIAVEQVEAVRPSRFAFRYFAGSLVVLSFEPDGEGGCDLSLVETGVTAGEYLENHAGWVSVLLACKAALEFGVDLRSHDARRSWAQRFVGN